MKTKRFFYSLLLLFIGSTLNVQSQVVIGDAVVPQSFSALEIISNGTGGLRLPQLTNAQRVAVQTAIEALAPAEQYKAEGLMIFNIDASCVEFWNGTEWISNCAGLVGSIGSLDCSGAAITAISGAAVNVTKTLTYSDLTGTVSVTDGQELGAEGSLTVIANGAQDLTDPSGSISVIITGTAPAASTSIPVELAGASCSISVTPCVAPTISAYSPTGRGITVVVGGSTVTTFGVTASGTGPFSYQWYKASSAVNSGGTAQLGATSATFITPSGLAGANYYYCVVTGDCGSINSDIFTITVGCGAPTKTGGWLTFMCHNLGANESLDPFTWNNSKGDADGSDIKGDLYQWGRKPAAHAKRNSATVQGPTDYPADNRFVLTATEGLYWGWRATPNNNLWGNGTQNMNMPKAANDPCPAGWKVPSQKQWESIYTAVESGANSTVQSDGTMSWLWTGNGYKVGSSLYLPAAGVRGGSIELGGLVEMVGVQGYYWSSTFMIDSYMDTSYSLHFASTSVAAPTSNSDRYGLSVRCVAE